MSQILLFAQRPSEGAEAFATLACFFVVCGIVAFVVWAIQADKARSAQQATVLQLATQEELVRAASAQPTANTAGDDAILAKQQEIEKQRERLNAMEAEFIAMLQTEKGSM